MITLEASVGILASFIAFLVWFTAHQQFKLQIFEKRWSIYERMRQIIAEFARNGTVDDEAVREFARLRHQTKYLFGRAFPRKLEIFESSITEAIRLDRIAERSSDNGKILDRRASAFSTATDFIRFESIFDRGLSVDDSLLSYLGNLAADHGFKRRT